MRVSAYDLRQAVLDPKYRPPAPGTPRAPMISTAGSLRKAIRTFHDDGEAAARAALRDSLSNYFARPGRPQTQAALARQALDTYIRLSAEDDRDAFLPHGRVDAPVGADSVAGDVDAVLLDPAGYVGRLLLFGPIPQPLSDPQLEMLAYAPVTALVAEFDGERVQGIDVWEVRLERIVNVPARNALRRDADVRRLIDRIRP